MRDFICPHWQKEENAAFAQALYEARLRCIASAIGLFALAVCVPYFIASGLSQSNVPTQAYEVRQAASGKEADGLSIGDSVCLADGMRLPGHLKQDNQEFRQYLVAYIGGNYKVPAALAHEIVDATFAASTRNNMDPLLVLGIIAKESSFNHKARSGYGATGLMQIHAPSHQALLEEMGIRDRDPKAVQKKLTSRVRLNVAAGIRIYKRYEKQYGSAVKALQAYNGAKHDRTQRYAKNVLAIRDDFKKLALQHGACG